MHPTPCLSTLPYRNRTKPFKQTENLTLHSHNDQLIITSHDSL